MHLPIIIRRPTITSTRKNTSQQVVYPFDVIKSVVQTRPTTSSSSSIPQPGMIQTGRELLRAHGPKVFWRGMSVACLRALPVNAIVFPIYEASVAGLGRLDPAHRMRRVESLRAEEAAAKAAKAAAVAKGAAGGDGPAAAAAGVEGRIPAV